MARAESGGIAAAAATLRVSVACSPREGTAVEIAVELGAAATAFDAIRASGVLERHPELDLSTLAVGIWGRACGLETELRAGDRVEIYRPLRLDPAEARRLRAGRTRVGARR